jgi:protein TonB
MARHTIRWESWELNAAADRRFRLICIEVLLPLLIFGIAMSLLQFERKTAPAPTPVRRYAQLLPPPPPPVKPKPEPVKEEPKPVEKPQPKPEPKPVTKPEPKPEPTAEQKTEAARHRAAQSGLVSLSADLAALRDSQSAEHVANGAATISGSGAPPKQASASTLGEARGSGGINTGALSRDTGAGSLGEHSTAKVEGAAGSAAAKAGKGKGGRDREEVEEVFDQNKGAIYALYNRALRDNPALQGKVVMKLTIEPDGSVSSCSIVSSELKDPELEAKLVERVKLFRFKAKDVGQVTTTKPLDFFPAN